MCFSIFQHCCTQNSPSVYVIFNLKPRNIRSRPVENPHWTTQLSADAWAGQPRNSLEKLSFPCHVPYMRVHSGSWCTCVLERIGFLTLMQHSKTKKESATCIRTKALRYSPTPLSIRLAGSTVCSLQCVAYITGVGHYRVVGCTGETALAICGSARITTVSGWGGWLGITDTHYWWGSIVGTARDTQSWNITHEIEVTSVTCTYT